MNRSVWLCFWSFAIVSIFGFASAWDELSAPRPEVVAHGKSVYHASCSACHGKSGKGNGIIAANLAVKPRDLTRGVYENRSTMSGQLPTKGDLFKTISEGIHSTSMPQFRGLSSEDREAVVEYIRTLSPRFADADEFPLDILADSKAPESTPNTLALGRNVYVTMKCADCHGATGKGEGEVVKQQFDELGEPVETPDLTDPINYEFSRSPRDLYRIFSTGLDGSPMPSYFATISETDRWYLAYYVWSLRQGMSYVSDSSQ